MVPELLESVLEDLCKLPNEIEWVEFKEAKQGYDFGKLGEYVSALANEANLKNRSCAWLVFGVRDNDRAIVGSRFRENVADLDHLKQEVAAQMNGGFTFLDIHPHRSASRCLRMMSLLYAR
jgi:ATP-dependent DNA helicase RecG